jgi:hypothetical protein
MSEDQKSSPKAISEKLREAVTELLSANGVYDLDSYGWLNADDADPELIGHVMWQTDSLSFRLLDARMEAMQSKTAKFPELDSWQRFLISVGGDFEGLMDVARLSIGLALFEWEVGDIGQFGANGFFQLHLIAAMVTLGAASDRLRDVFVASIFHENTKQYEAGKWKDKSDRRRYDAPFAEAAERLQLLATAPESVVKLPVLADEIHTFRQVRNAVVHDLATETGRLAYDIANKPRPPTYSEALEMAHVKVRERATEAEDEHLTWLAGEMARPINWYKLLIEMSNHVFIVENRLRRRVVR